VTVKGYVISRFTVIKRDRTDLDAEYDDGRDGWASVENGAYVWDEHGEESLVEGT